MVASRPAGEQKTRARCDASNSYPLALRTVAAHNQMVVVVGTPIGCGAHFSHR
jgi:hypothetical protein